MTDIPNIFHFVFGLRPQTEPLHVVHYLCLESCRRVYHPGAMHFYYRYEPYGVYWKRIRPYLTLHRIADGQFAPHARRYRETAEGQLIEKAGWSYAHEADFIRLRAIAELGGVYADMDTLFIQPMPQELFRHDFVLGEESPFPGVDGILRPSLCNAVMLSRPGAAFPALWLERMTRVFDGTWSRHSCQEATLMWSEMPEKVHVVPQRYFYHYPPTRAGIHLLLQGLSTGLQDVYSLHLWAHLWWDEWRTDFSTFHAGLLDAEYIRKVDTTYNVIARRFLD